MTFFFVIGPESAGNRLMTRLLIEAGCYGDGDMFQRLDKEIPANLQHAVWLRSYPHGPASNGRHWPNLRLLGEKIAPFGYIGQVLIMHRDIHSMALSQVAAGHVADYKSAIHNIKEAYRRIHEQTEAFGYGNYTPIIYENLVARPQGVCDWLMPSLGLPSIQVKEYIYDGNEKYYK